MQGWCVLKLGKYKIDSVWSSIIGGFFVVSVFFPFMWVSILVLLVFAIKKDNE
ncbi:hypothetical protein [Mammaliicoccus sciuri]|uniref:hypothetical protein n=1 Tax=Mammaliicoccus sciuri TaxID=1296 RepID=UPI000A9727FA|nr:hypothetical protein [Mammaliicoccus sciuri]MCD8800624.1 hypothetical protein [Mammaliicoccus sciuri]MEB5567571.1 hypothetical protein [Mammaliicoccus sciuri]MEB7436196.1 hypothetical protein [Mammaliicoccus sciuri]MEB7965540.1 hypothetical protein [Mammaliicoccus sciuri]MEB8294163.1 hypothetical protein [Mammaliicoccus sciuri]